MAIVPQRETFRRWKVDTGNSENSTNPVIGLKDDRALVSIERFFHEESGKDRYRVALDAENNELRATNGLEGNIVDIFTREAGGQWPNRYLMIQLEDEAGTKELIDVGSVFSTVARAILSCFRATDTPLIGATLKIKTYPNTPQGAKRPFTNSVMELNGVRLRWAYERDWLNENYPAKKLIMGEDGIPIDNINKQPRTVRDEFWDSELDILTADLQKEREAANVSTDAKAVEGDTPKVDEDDIPF